MLTALNCSSRSSLTCFSYARQRCYGADPIIRSVDTSVFSRCPGLASRRPVSIHLQAKWPLHKAGAFVADGGSANVGPSSVNDLDDSRFRSLLSKALGIFTLSGLFLASLCLLRLQPRSGAPLARIQSTGSASILSSSTHGADTPAIDTNSQHPSSENGSKAKGIEIPLIQVGKHGVHGWQKHTTGTCAGINVANCPELLQGKCSDVFVTNKLCVLTFQPLHSILSSPSQSRILSLLHLLSIVLGVNAHLFTFSFARSRTHPLMHFYWWLQIAEHTRCHQQAVLSHDPVPQGVWDHRGNASKGSGDSSGQRAFSETEPRTGGRNSGGTLCMLNYFYAVLRQHYECWEFSWCWLACPCLFLCTRCSFERAFSFFPPFYVPAFMAFVEQISARLAADYLLSSSLVTIYLFLCVPCLPNRSAMTGSACPRRPHSLSSIQGLSVKP